MDFLTIPIVAIAVSIVICWALFAIFCSLLHEAIAEIKAERGRYLRKWLLRQLYDHPNGVNWASLVYMHGTVDLLAKSSKQPPSDITPKLFAETIIEVAGSAQLVQMHKAQLQQESGEAAKLFRYQSPVLNNFKAATLVLKPSDVVSFFQQSMGSAEMCSRPDGTPDETAIYKCLVAQIENWYGVMMDRMSGWYKKKTRVRLFLLGGLTALILNVDSLQLFTHFSRNPLARQELIAYYDEQADNLEALARDTQDPIARGRLDSFSRELQRNVQLTALPIGWSYSLINPRRVESEGGSGNFLFRILGLLLSGFAVSFGAPFWFDLLRRARPRKS